jgi:WD40 repeat protein
VALWDIPRHRLLTLGARGDGESLAFSDDGAILAAGGLDGLAVWNVRERRIIDRAPAADVVSVAFGPQDQLAADYIGGDVRVWRVRQRLEPLASFKAPNISAEGLAWSSPSKLIVADESGATEWAIGGTPHSRLLLPPALTRHFSLVAVTPQSRLVVGVGLGAVQAWSLGSESGFTRARYTTDRYYPYESADSLPAWIRTSALDALLRASQSNPSTATVRSPDGRLTLLLHNPGVSLYRAPARLLHSEPNAVTASFQPHGKLIALGEANARRTHATTFVPSMIVFRDADTWKLVGEKLVATMASHAKIARLAFSPDGSMLASGTCTSCGPFLPLGSTTRMWDVRERIAIGQPLPGLPLTFSPDGTHLALLDDQLQVVVVDDTPWTTDFGRLQTRVCALVHRSLTRAEWRAFVGDAPYRATCG